MHTLKPTELRSFEQFFQLTQDNLLKIMGKYLKTKYEKVYSTSDYLVAIGDIPVALAAHVDTVFAKPPENIFYDRVKNVMWSPDGLGADDRAGVYSIVQILKRGYKPTIIFTTDEEKGALGATALIRDHHKALTDLKYIIQLDRRGSTDCIFYDCDNPKFEEYVESFGFVTAHGTFTDISIICPSWGVAGVNLSVGYVNEHSYSETLYVGNMLATINKVENMLKDINNAEYFKYIPAKYYYSPKSIKNIAYGWDDDYNWDASYGISKELWRSWHEATEVYKCSKCGNDEYDYNLIPIKTTEHDTVFMCIDCVNEAENINWCRICGEAFIVKENENPDEVLTCYDCEGGQVYGF